MLPKRMAFLAALVAVQAFGAKPAEASLGPGVVRVIDEFDGAARGADDLENPPRLEADGTVLTDDDALRETGAQIRQASPDGIMVTR